LLFFVFFVPFVVVAFSRVMRIETDHHEGHEEHEGKERTGNRKRPPGAEYGVTGSGARSSAAARMALAIAP
jgi:hypothetical protein